MLQKKHPTLFFVDRSTGALSNIVPLDAERQKNYRFGVIFFRKFQRMLEKLISKVRACLESNDTICGYTEVVVFVIDVNDNAPSFSQPEYKVRLPAAANLYPGIELFHANATDNDSGPLGYVRENNVKQQTSRILGTLYLKSSIQLPGFVLN